MQTSNKITLLLTLALSATASFSGAQSSGTGMLAPVWSLAPGDRAYITDGHDERAMGYNPVTGNVLIPSRANGADIYVLDGETGADLFQLDASVILEGNLIVNQIGVADDGVIYAANLVNNPTSASTPFKLYRWESEGATVAGTVAYEGTMGDVSRRWGDTFAIRGSGTSTQILVSSYNADAVAVFTTTDGSNFTPVIMPVDGLEKRAFSHGLEFGAGDTFWGKGLSPDASENRTLRHASFDLATESAALLRNYEDVVPEKAGAIGVDTSNELLATLSYDGTEPDSLQLYDISDLENGPLLMDQALMPADNSSGIEMGSVYFVGDRVAAFGVAMGAAVFDVNEKPPQEEPEFLTQPSDQTVWAGTEATLSVSAYGADPIAYQWFLNDEEITGATGTAYTIPAAQPSDEGVYHVVATNSFGSTQSSSAVLTVQPLVDSGMLDPLWSLAPGDRTYVNADHTERALGYNPVTGNVLIPSRADGADIYVVDGQNGDELFQMDTSAVLGGTLRINQIGVAEDGVVYAANVVSSPTSTNPFKIYRWEREGKSWEVFSTIAYAGTMDDVDQRWGDTFAVRGSGVDTQIVVSSFNSKAMAVFTTTDGLNFTPVVMYVEEMPDRALQHGLAFGEGDTVWGNAKNKPLQHVVFDLDAGTASVLGEYMIHNGVGAIGVDVSRGLLAGIAVDEHDHVRLYDIGRLDSGPVLLEQELLPANKSSGLDFGSVVFGADSLAATGVSNGISFFTLSEKPLPVAVTISRTESMITLEWKTVASRSYQVQYKDDLRDSVWVNTGSSMAGSGAVATHSDDTAGVPKRFYRVLESL